jgi:hypothetical protein
MNDRAMWSDIWRFYLLARQAATDRQIETAAQTMSQLSAKYQSELCDALLCAVWTSKGVDRA